MGIWVFCCFVFNVRICFYLILRLKEMLMGLREIQWFGDIHSGMLAAEFREMM